jgi:putative tryptophan/tyrosine transport system substrate-binding protein
VTIEVFEARSAIELDRVFPLIARSGIRAVILAQDPLFGAERKHLAELGGHHRLPILSGESGFAQAGGLMDYGPSLFDNFRAPRAMSIRSSEVQIRAISRSSRRPSSTLGLTIPPSLLQRADQVIE